MPVKVDPRSLITKFGTVTITNEKVSLDGFEFERNLNAAMIGALYLAQDKIEERIKSLFAQGLWSGHVA